MTVWPSVLAYVLNSMLWVSTDVEWTWLVVWKSKIMRFLKNLSTSNRPLKMESKTIFFLWNFEWEFLNPNNKKKQKRDKKRKKERLHTFFTAILDALLSRQTNTIFFKGIFRDLKNLKLVPGCKNCLNTVKIQFLKPLFQKIQEVD